MFKQSGKNVLLGVVACAAFAFCLAITTKPSAAAEEGQGIWTSKGGRQAASQGAAPSLLTDCQGTSYLLYREVTSGTYGKPKVKKFDGQVWQEVGGPFVSETSAADTRLALSGSTPYVAFRETAGGEIRVRKATAGRWADVGNPGSIQGYDMDFVISDGIPYVAVVNGSPSGTLKVMKYTEDAGWTTLGGVNALGADKVFAPSLTVSDGQVYVAFKDKAKLSKATVLRYSDQSRTWEALGGRGFTEGVADQLSIGTGGGKLYAAFLNNGQSKQGKVMAYTPNDGWRTVGDPVSDGTAASITLLTGEGHQPYVAYKSDARLLVKQFNGREWLAAGHELSGSSPALSLYGESLSMAYVEGAYAGGPISVVQLNKEIAFQLNGTPKDRRAALSWEAVQGAVSYQVYGGDASGRLGDIPLAALDSRVTGYQWDGLMNGRTYYARVRALLPEGSLESNVIHFTMQPILPAAPNHFTARALARGRVALQWDAVNDRSGSLADAAGYRVGADARRTLLADGLTQTAYVAEGTPGGGTSYYAVTAYNDNGESEYSLIAGATSAETVWEPLGSEAGISVGRGTFNAIRIYNGTPFIAYADEALGGKVSVLQYTAAGWTPVGKPGFSGKAGSVSLFVDGGVPYVSMNDADHGNGLTVMRYTGGGTTGWETVGQPNLTGGFTNETSLYIDGGTPYVAFNATTGLQGTLVKVMKYADGVWQYVGDYSAEQGNNGANNISLYVDRGTPYVGYRSKGLGGEVIRFDRGVWRLLGGKDFTSKESTNIRWSSLYVYGGVPYLGYTMDGGVQLSRYRGGAWEYVGSKGFYQPGAWLTQLSFSSGGVPYMLFTDEKNDGKPVVMKYTGRGGTGWEQTGNRLFSKGRAEYTSLALGNGKIYAAYSDESNGGRTTVMVFDDNAAAPWMPTSDDEFSRSTTGSGSGQTDSAKPQADTLAPEAPLGVTGAPLMEMTAQQLSRLAQVSTDGGLFIQAQQTGSDPQASVEIRVPARALREAADILERITFANGLVSVSVAAKELRAVLPREAESVSVLLRAIPEADMAGSNLPEAARTSAYARLGGGRVYEFRWFVDASPIPGLGEGRRGTIKLTYGLKPRELAHGVVASKLNGPGGLEVMPRSRYDAESGVLSVAADASGLYAVGYMNAGFHDLERVSWAQTAIEALAARRLVQGIDEGIFAPGTAITRGQFAHVLVRALGFATDADHNRFPDVTPGDWYARSVAAAEKLGIVGGRSDGTFGADDPLTREEMAVMLHRAASAAGARFTAEPEPALPDQSTVSGFAAEAVEALRSVKLMQGTSDGRFDPQAQASRAQAATVIYALLKWLGQA